MGFANGDPISYSDPYGLNPILLACAGGAVGGVATGWGVSQVAGLSYSARDAGIDAGLGCIGGAAGSSLASLRHANRFRQVRRLGRWVPATESMSARAAAYQAWITGRAGQVFVKNGVKFDGFARGTLIEAKEPGYATFTPNGQFQEWWRGADGLVDQARRQLRAADGVPIQWHFAEEAAANATRALFRERGISGIQIVVTP